MIPMLYCDLLTDAMIKGLGQQKVSVRYNILTSAMDVALLFLLLPRYGMTGYLISFFATHLINFGLSLRRLLKITKIHIPVKIPVFALLTMAVSILGCEGLPDGVTQVAAYTLLLGSLLTLFGITGMEDLRWFRGLVGREKVASLR